MAADCELTDSSADGISTRVYKPLSRIFKLSDIHPVGVIIYSSTEFMGNSWNLILKLYQNHRGKMEQTSLRGYAEDFIDFLHSEKFFCSEEEQQKYLVSELMEFYNHIKLDTHFNARDREKYADDPQRLTKILKESINNFIREGTNINEILPEVKDYPIERLRKYGVGAFDNLMDRCKKDGLDGVSRSMWEKGFLTYLKTYWAPFGTGIVFVGYGADDIYPSILPTVFSGVFDNRLRYYFNDYHSETISNNKRAIVRPFGRVDVMMSLMKGITSDLKVGVLDGLYSVVQEANDWAIKTVEKNGGSKKMLEEIKQLDFKKIEGYLFRSCCEYEKKAMDSFVKGVGSFSIDEMANLAESFVSLTNLQYHISSEEEGEGGPVDVAVITRSEGFVWVKHKEWFNAAKG